MSEQWRTWVRRDAVLRGCGTCGGLFLLAIADDRPERPVCGAAGSDPDWFAAMVRQFQGPATLNAGVRLQLDMLVRVFPADPDEQSEWPEDLRVREWPS